MNAWRLQSTTAITHTPLLMQATGLAPHELSHGGYLHNRGPDARSQLSA
jgi:hypothetical protein